MTAQEWLNELLRLREAATPGPWKHNIEPRRDVMGFIWPFSSIEREDAKAIEDEEENVTDSITSADAAYIVAACNAMPRLIDMIEYLAGRLCDEDHGDNDFDGKIQDAFDITEPEE